MPVFSTIEKPYCWVRELLDDRKMTFIKQRTTVVKGHVGDATMGEMQLTISFGSLWLETQ